MLAATITAVFLSLGGPADARAQATFLPAGVLIQDNSFLLEEAYNQEAGVVQHISSFTRFWDSKSWAYTFTQEWPIPSLPRHQLSFTATVVRAGSLADSRRLRRHGHQLPLSIARFQHDSFCLLAAPQRAVAVRQTAVWARLRRNQRARRAAL